MKSEKSKKDSRGGARPGAGRPKGDSRMISFRAPGALADSLDRMEDRAGFIRRSLAEAVRELEGVSANDVPAAGRMRPTEGKPSGGLEALGNMVPAGRVRCLSLPFFDQRVVAGFPVPLDNDERSQDIDILSMLVPHPEASYLIRVNGDSMIDAGIMSGDVVIVDKSNRDPSPKEVAVCELNGEYTLKHFVREGDEGWLVPANPAYPRFRIGPDDDFSIWGTVTYIIHRAREQ